jgi:hypothetical protein
VFSRGSGAFANSRVALLMDDKHHLARTKILSKNSKLTNVTPGTGIEQESGARAIGVSNPPIHRLQIGVKAHCTQDRFPSVLDFHMVSEIRPACII